nr:unnamed protein product [Callosobruchus analis]
MKTTIMPSRRIMESTNTRRDTKRAEGLRPLRKLGASKKQDMENPRSMRKADTTMLTKDTKRAVAKNLIMIKEQATARKAKKMGSKNMIS